MVVFHQLFCFGSLRRVPVVNCDWFPASPLRQSPTDSTSDKNPTSEEQKSPIRQAI